MAYNFKSLGEVELLSAMPENANVLVEVDGATRRAPQVEQQVIDVAAELIATEALTEVPEGATVLAEVDGEIKRVPSDGLGGASGIEPLFVYVSSDDTSLTDKNGNIYDLTTLLDAYTQSNLFYVTAISGINYPERIYAFQISGNIGFVHDSSGRVEPNPQYSIYTPSDLAAYYTEKYGGL